MKRYSLWEDPMTALTRAGRLEMKEFPDGDWVRQEDVEALQALNAEMLEVLKQIAKWHDYEVSTHELCMRMYWSSRLAYDAIAKAEGRQG